MLESPIEISFVIPVYNGSGSIARVVAQICETFATESLEIILVNDGSTDDSEVVCRELAAKYPTQLTFVDLARNFGEHSAVLAGLTMSRGRYVAVLDDDGQNPPQEVQRLWDFLRTNHFDVVYGRYFAKQHHWFRNLGSRFNDRLATLMLRKPRQIYLSSFKVMTRFVVRQVTQYRGPFPYIDGLIFRTTRNIGQLEVRHVARETGTSGYNLRRLVRLWLNMFLGFSIAPLRLSVLLGLGASGLSLLLMLGILIDKLWINPNVPVGIPSILACVTLFSGIQLVVLGMVGEYVGRIFLEQNGTPQYVIRSVIRGMEDETADGNSNEPPSSVMRIARTESVSGVFADV